MTAKPMSDETLEAIRTRTRAGIAFTTRKEAYIADLDCEALLAEIDCLKSVANGLSDLLILRERAYHALEKERDELRRLDKLAREWLSTEMFWIDLDGCSHELIDASKRVCSARDLYRAAIKEEK